MKCLKINAILNGTGNKVKRTFLVNPNINLEEFAANVLSSFNASFEHYFLVETKGMVYYHKDWEDQDLIWDEEYGLYKDITLQKLLDDHGESFKIVYDTGEDYIFNIKVLETIEADEPEDNIEIKSISGLGIFENAHYLLQSFLKTKSMKKSLKIACEGSDDELDYYLPYNQDLDIDSTIDDYFAEIDLESANDLMHEGSYTYLNSDIMCN